MLPRHAVEGMADKRGSLDQESTGSFTKMTYGCLYVSLFWTCRLWLDTGFVLMRFDGILTEMTYVCVYSF